jgi:hypothetical protein
MVAQCQGGPHKVECDEEDALRLPYVTASSWMGAELVVVRLSRVLLSLFEGCGVEEGQEWAVQCQGVTPAIPHNTCTTPSVAAQRRVGRTAPRSDSQAVLGDRRGRDSPLTRAPSVCRGTKASSRGSRWGAAGRGRPRARRRLTRRAGTPERGGDPLEGLKPSSEAEAHPRGQKSGIHPGYSCKEGRRRTPTRIPL